MRKGFKIVLLICTMLLMLACTSPAQKFFKEGLSYRDQQKWDEAIAAYTKAIEINPKFANAYNNRAYAYIQKEDKEAALADFTKAIELDPKQVIGYKNRAWTYVMAEEYDKAIVDLKKALELTKDSSEIQLINQAIEAIQQKQGIVPFQQIQTPSK